MIRGVSSMAIIISLFRMVSKMVTAGNANSADWKVALLFFVPVV